MSAAGMVSWSRRHWFYLLLPLWLAITVNLHLTFEWQAEPRLGEALVLFDWCIFIPALYAVCYWGRSSARALGIKLLALSCLGLWVAGKVVPDTAEGILRDWSWLRQIGLAALVAVEIAAVCAALRVAFSSRPDVVQLERQGVPPLLARLMLAEARFWRWVWSKMRGR